MCEQKVSHVENLLRSGTLRQRWNFFFLLRVWATCIQNSRRTDSMTLLTQSISPSRSVSKYWAGQGSLRGFPLRSMPPDRCSRAACPVWSCRTAWRIVQSKLEILLYELDHSSSGKSPQIQYFWLLYYVSLHSHIQLFVLFVTESERRLNLTDTLSGYKTTSSSPHSRTSTAKIKSGTNRSSIIPNRYHLVNRYARYFNWVGGLGGATVSFKPLAVAYSGTTNYTPVRGLRNAADPTGETSWEKKKPMKSENELKHGCLCCLWLLQLQIRHLLHEGFAILFPPFCENETLTTLLETYLLLGTEWWGADMKTNLNEEKPKKLCKIKISYQITRK